MGGKHSKPSAVLQEEWRPFSWEDTDENFKYVRNYKPRKKIRLLRVMICGPVGAGKSSFITSVMSVIEERLVSGALANASTNDESFTKVYKTHKISKDENNFVPFVLCDTVGLEPTNTNEACVSDIQLALKGHMKEQYEFDPSSPLSEDSPFYNPKPGPEDKVHVLVFVVNGNSSEIPDPILESMTKIRKEASKLGIPQVALVTHIDEACKETDKNLKNVYKSRFLKTKMMEISSGTGIPLNCILPVKNYSKDYKQHPDMNALILSAMRQILEFGNDFVKTMELNIVPKQRDD
ncbi:interferon-induced protein 44-like isoform 1-T4 [Menidia menidia]